MVVFNVCYGIFFLGFKINWIIEYTTKRAKMTIKILLETIFKMNPLKLAPTSPPAPINNPKEKSSDFFLKFNTEPTNDESAICKIEMPMDSSKECPVASMIGTMIIPPPMPKIPDKMPVNSPIVMYNP